MISPAVFFEICSVLKIDEIDTIALVSADKLLDRHVGNFAPDAPVLIAGLGNAALLPAVQKVLRSVYPGSHLVHLVRLTAKGGDVVESAIENISGDDWTALYIPPLPVGSSFETFQDVIAHLRAPDGCPWDRQQTHLTLRKHLLEESYETLSALDEENPEKMREEFGDLLLQIVLNAQIGSEYGEFTMTDILKGIHDKIVRRHPHVFGEVKVDGVGDVLSNWESIKKDERNKKGEGQKSLLDGIPVALPALSQAQEVQERAARVGFDWPEIDGVLEKIREEIEEVRSAENVEQLSDELGDLFFALVNLARWKKVDAEAALRGTTLKFKRRFSYIESQAHLLKRPLKDLSLQEMDALWDQAKKFEKHG